MKILSNSLNWEIKTMLNAINILNKLFFLKKVFAFLLILIAILSLNETSSKEDALSENQTIYYANFLKPKNCRINTVFGSFLCKKIKKTIPLKNKTWRHDKSLPSFQKYVIASQGEATTKAGARMFNLGGNIVDAAIAISFAISVERPQSTGDWRRRVYAHPLGKTGKNSCPGF